MQYATDDKGEFMYDGYYDEEEPPEERPMFVG